jgi:hypothetical protein
MVVGGIPATAAFLRARAIWRRDRGNLVAFEVAYVAWRQARVHAARISSARRRGAPFDLFSRCFYEYYTQAPRKIDGLNAAIDQSIAGAVLMIVGKVTLAVAAFVIFFRWFGEEQRADRVMHSAAYRLLVRWAGGWLRLDSGQCF